MNRCLRIGDLAALIISRMEHLAFLKKPGIYKLGQTGLRFFSAFNLKGPPLR